MFLSLSLVIYCVFKMLFCMYLVTRIFFSYNVERVIHARRIRRMQSEGLISRRIPKLVG